MIFEAEKIILQVYEIQKNIHLFKANLAKNIKVVENKKKLKFYKQKLTSINNTI